MIVRYMRVSTTNQENLRQEYLLDKIGVKFNKSYQDIMTGKTKDRPGLTKMLLDVKNGDIVYAESISRLGRNLKDLIDIIDTLINKGVRVIILKEGIDTNSNTYKLLLGIFGAIAEMERETTQERTKQSIDALKEIKSSTGEIRTRSGKWFGREEITKNDLPKDFKKYYNKMLNGEITKVEMAKLLGVARNTIYRWIKIYKG